MSTQAPSPNTNGTGDTQAPWSDRLRRHLPYPDIAIPALWLVLFFLLPFLIVLDTCRRLTVCHHLQRGSVSSLCIRKQQN